jgi:hypothetical protein
VTGEIARARLEWQAKLTIISILGGGGVDSSILCLSFAQQ